MTWNRGNLARLYNTEGKTLQEIGDIYGVSRERIRQVMDKLGLPRNTRRSNPHLVGNTLYKSFQEYLDSAPLRKKDGSKVLCRFFAKLLCSECGSIKHLHLHHINYPATKQEDIQILCASCHKMKHNGKMSYAKQLDLYHRYKAGETVKFLAKDYGLSNVLIHKIIHKIKNGLHALKR